MDNFSKNPFISYTDDGLELEKRIQALLTLQQSLSNDIGTLSGRLTRIENKLSDSSNEIDTLKARTYNQGLVLANVSTRVDSNVEYHLANTRGINNLLTKFNRLEQAVKLMRSMLLKIGMLVVPNILRPNGYRNIDCMKDIKDDYYSLDEEVLENGKD